MCLRGTSSRWSLKHAIQIAKPPANDRYRKHAANLGTEFASKRAKDYINYAFRKIHRLETHSLTNQAISCGHGQYLNYCCDRNIKRIEWHCGRSHNHCVKCPGRDRIQIEIIRMKFIFIRMVKSFYFQCIMDNNYDYQ